MQGRTEEFSGSLYRKSSAYRFGPLDMTTQTLVLSPDVEGIWTSIPCLPWWQMILTSRTGPISGYFCISNLKSEFRWVGDSVFSAWCDEISMSIIHVLTGSVKHSFRDCSHESHFFTYGAKLLIRNHHVKSLQVIAPTFSRDSLCRWQVCTKVPTSRGSTCFGGWPCSSEMDLSTPVDVWPCIFQPSLCTNSMLLRRYWADLLSEWCVALYPCSLRPPWSEWCVFLIFASKFTGRAHLCLGKLFNHLIGLLVPFSFWRVSIRPISFSSVPGPRTGNWPRANCLRITCSEFETFSRLWIHCPINVIAHWHEQNSSLKLLWIFVEFSGLSGFLWEPQPMWILAKNIPFELNGRQWIPNNSVPSLSWWNTLSFDSECTCILPRHKTEETWLSCIWSLDHDTESISYKERNHTSQYFEISNEFSNDQPQEMSNNALISSKVVFSRAIKFVDIRGQSELLIPSLSTL